ncbi:hypothetical protein MVEN_01869600 [Mycena venus]|uniref:Uncharacterized protein n=1 Tax=Mycena venus TaxID=2733690 RepID=A0A8H6XIX1_9AGAR|nr:hypothetical protein MVEN_01869600 [Mycena venus]
MHSLKADRIAEHPWHCPPSTPARMSAFLTFTNKDILNGSLVLPNGAVRYTISTGSQFLGLKRAPTIVTALTDNITGSVNWEGGTFTIGGVERPWKTLKHHVWDQNKEEWKWGDISYTVRFSSEWGEWTARPTQGWTDVARLEQRKNAPPTLALSAELGDETERMFMVLVMIFCKKIIGYA